MGGSLLLAWKTAVQKSWLQAWLGQNLLLVAWVHLARLPICHSTNHGKDLTASSCKGERSLQLARAKS
jgi:hypothetical protein